MSEKPDNVLLEEIRAGGTPALRELFFRYYSSLCRFAYAYVGQRDQAEEAISRVFEDLWRRRADLLITTSVKAWLYGAARHQAVDRMRVTQRQRAVPLESLPPEAVEDPESGRESILRTEFDEEVERVISTLPAQRQLVFRMNRIDGLRYREIALVLGVSEHTVQNHMVLAVRQLSAAVPRLRELIQS